MVRSATGTAPIRSNLADAGGAGDVDLTEPLADHINATKKLDPSA